MIICSNFSAETPRLEVLGSTPLISGSVGAKLSRQANCWKELVAHWNGLIRQQEDFAACMAITAHAVALAKNSGSPEFVSELEKVGRLEREINRKHFPLWLCDRGFGQVAREAAEASSSVLGGADYYTAAREVGGSNSYSPALMDCSFNLQFHPGFDMGKAEAEVQFLADSVELGEFASHFSGMVAGRDVDMSYRPRPVRPNGSVGIRGKALDPFSEIISKWGFCDTAGWSAIRAIAALFSAQCCSKSLMALSEVKFGSNHKESLLAQVSSVPLGSPPSLCIAMVHLSSCAMMKQAEVANEFEVPVRYVDGEENALAMLSASCCLTMPVMTTADADLAEAKWHEVHGTRSEGGLSDTLAAVNQSQSAEKHLRSMLRGREKFSQN